MVPKLRLFIFILIFIFVFALFPAEAQSFLENLHFSYNGSIFLFASNNGANADPSQIVPSLGLSIAYPLFKFLRVELIEDVYFTNYEYNFTYGYPMACSSENRKTFVIGFMTGFQAAGIIPISKNGITVRIFGGIAFDLRLAVQAFGLHPDDAAIAKAHTDAVSKYFWSNGRFLSAPAGAGIDFPVSRNFLAGLDLRLWIPLYRFWTGETIPSIDGWRFGASVRVTPRKNNTMDL